MEFVDSLSPRAYSAWLSNPDDLRQPPPPGEHVRLFRSDLLEACSLTPVWVPLAVWLPVAAAISAPSIAALPVTSSLALLVWGALTWSCIEYLLHRFLFHIDPARISSGAAFLLHGIHHYASQDELRLVMPPPLTFFCGGLIFVLSAVLARITGMHMQHSVWYAGGILGYVVYDETHYCLHHLKGGPLALRRLRARHLVHHHVPTLNFGVTTSLWDTLCRTARVRRAAPRGTAAPAKAA